MSFKLKKYRLTLLKSIAILLFVLLLSGISKIVAEKIEMNSNAAQVDIVLRESSSLKGENILSKTELSKHVEKNDNALNSQKVMSSITSITVRTIF